MVKPLTFKGDKKSRKRKAPHSPGPGDPDSTIVALNSSEVAKDDHQEDDTWVNADIASDLRGPVIFVLPSPKPSCIACDANGTVFASELENIVDEDPSTAEPHDVRQVWIANSIAGTDEISFKGHHGRYLSTDKIGFLSANREAISPEESFLCVASPDTTGLFSVQTVREKFLTTMSDEKHVEIRGDADAISFTTTLRIRMQARFKPRLRAHKEQRLKERISRKELEDIVGRRLEDDEVRTLKKSRMKGDFHEAILDVRVKGKHDKYT